LRVKLPLLDSWTARRQEAAAHYSSLFSDRGLDRIQTPPVVQSRHIFNQFVVRLDERDGLREHLKKHKIGCEVYYPLPMHLQECFAGLGHKQGEFPESEQAALTSLALPMFPELTAQQRERVVDAVAGYFKARSGLGHRMAA
jgi:dTDP-4-amino-4,6-dideoxygalactose transaminase